VEKHEAWDLKRTGVDRGVLSFLPARTLPHRSGFLDRYVKRCTVCRGKLSNQLKIDCKLMNVLNYTRKLPTRKVAPNPPPKVFCSSDYGLLRSSVGFHSTMSPDCGCGFDQNDRADINSQPSVDSDLSR